MKPRLNDRDVYRLTTLYDAPEFVKSADLSESIGRNGDALYVTGDRGVVYATHTKAAAWLSLAAVIDAGDKSPGVDAACKFYGLEPERSRILAKKAAFAAAESPTSNRVYAWPGDPPRIDVTTADGVKAAAAMIVNDDDVLDPEDRVAIAERVVARSRKLGVRLGEVGRRLDKLAGYGIADPDAVVHGIAARAAAVRLKHPDVAAELDQWADALATSPDSLSSRKLRIKAAITLRDVDREFGLRSRYDSAASGVRRPEDSLFAIGEADLDAVAANRVEIVPGTLHAKSAIEAVPVNRVREQLGDSLADGVTDDGVFLSAEKVAAAPNGDRRLIAAALAALNVVPVGPLVA